MLGVLPNFLKFKTTNDLIRIGKDNDGGYLVSQSDIYKSDLLISLGIFDDWSFESDFVSVNSTPVKAYDASVNVNFWIKKSIIQFVKDPLSFYAIKKLISYKRFFKENREHIQKFVGLNTSNDIHCTFESVIEEVESKNIFLKIDIEGSEYRLLDALILYQNRICGLVLELHDCDLHMDSIEKFVSKFNLNLVHIHANNFAPVKLDDGLPLVLELTFSSNCKLEDYQTLPHKLDMPNDSTNNEINLIFET